MFAICLHFVYQMCLSKRVFDLWYFIIYIIGYMKYCCQSHRSIIFLGTTRGQFLHCTGQLCFHFLNFLLLVVRKTEVMSGGWGKWSSRNWAVSQCVRRWKITAGIMKLWISNFVSTGGWALVIWWPTNLYRKQTFY